jgi:DNA-binding transcriptional ArsR family regulator
MKDGPDIASLAALIGDPARANMLSALLSGQALTASELAREAGVTAQTASAHLAKLAEAGLLVRERQGRHRYVRLAGADVAETLEVLLGFAARNGRLRTRPGPRDEALRHARICFDHLAGQMGVRLHDALVEDGRVVATLDGLGLSTKGRSWLADQGICLTDLDRGRRPICRACLDWSERRHHLAGRLGAALLDLVIARQWARRDATSRAILFDKVGYAQFEGMLAGSKEGDVSRT